MIDLCHQRDYVTGHIGNADERQYGSTCPQTQLWQRKELSNKLMRTGNEHLRYKVMLACTGDGKKLAPL